MKPRTHHGFIAGLLVAVVASALAHASDPGKPKPTRVIECGGYVTPAGEIETPGVVVLAGWKIVQVGGEIAADLPVERYPTTVLCPGLIDCHATVGVDGDMVERSDAVQPRVAAHDAFDRFSPQFTAALHAGVTAVALTPDDQNLVGGRMAICQTGGEDGQPRVLTGNGPLKLSLAPDAYKVDREPTSRSAAVGLLRSTLARARADGAPHTPLKTFARGQHLGLLTAPTAADVMAALDLAEQFDLKLSLGHTADARLIAELLSGKVHGVVVGPLRLTSPRREARAAAKFAAHDVPVAVAGGLPDAPADSLRIGAAVAARGGLSPAAARRAITIEPARVLGVADQIGRIEAGARADLVVFSGDPLDLRSSVVAVYIGGQRVYLARERAEGEPR